MKIQMKLKNAFHKEKISKLFMIFLGFGKYPQINKDNIFVKMLVINFFFLYFIKI